MEALKVRTLEIANSYNSQTVFAETYKLKNELRRMDGSYRWMDDQYNECCYNDGMLIATYSSPYHESICFIINHVYVCYTTFSNIFNINTAYVDYTQLCQIHDIFTSKSNEDIGGNEDVSGLLSAMESIIGETKFIDI